MSGHILLKFQYRKAEKLYIKALAKSGTEYLVKQQKAAEKAGVDLSRKILNDDEEGIEKANEVSYNLNDNEEASYGQREESSQSRNRGRLGQHTDGGYNNRGWGAAISSDNKSVQGILERNIKGRLGKKVGEYFSEVYNKPRTKMQKDLVYKTAAR